MNHQQGFGRVTDGSGVTISSVFVVAPDGLRLHVRIYRPARALGLPAICLPGLTRTTADFDDLAMALASDTRKPRRVLALDSRGRGLSDHDPDPAKYTLGTELADLLAVLAALDVPPAVFVGTSRGGLLTMLLASVQPGAIAGAILNDIGPVIDPEGLKRIQGYVGKLPKLKSFEEGAAAFQRLFGAHFPKFTDQDWLSYARRSFKAGTGRLEPTYDVAISKNLASLDFTQPLPDMWPQFEALATVPLMVVRGQNTDLLSEATMTAMAARHPGMQAVFVPDQGHAPVLAGADLLGRLVAFAAACDPHPAA